MGLRRTRTSGSSHWRRKVRTPRSCGTGFGGWGWVWVWVWVWGVCVGGHLLKFCSLGAYMPKERICCTRIPSPPCIHTETHTRSSPYPAPLLHLLRLLAQWVEDGLHQQRVASMGGRHLRPHQQA
jgi:hypothetical protein